MKIDLKKDLSMPKLSVPKLGKPSLPGRPKSINGPASPRRGPEIKAPKIVTDLYGDLRDRRLLPLVALLIVAIVAAPIVFGGKGGSDEPVAAPTISPGETSDSAFTVVPAESTLRSPEKRLGHRHPLNPFRQESSEVVNSVDSQQAKELAAAAIAGAAIESSTPEGGSAEPSPTESPVVESPAESPTPSPESPVVTPPPGGAEAKETETKTTTESTTTESSTEASTAQTQYVVNLKTGFDPEHLQEMNEVQPMTKLPNEKNPAILYIGLSQDQKRALFLLTSKVTAYYGAAHCVLDKLSCELVELKAGKSATFEIGLGEEATRYKIALESIEPVKPGSKSAQETTTTETRSSNPDARARSIGAAHRFNK